MRHLISGPVQPDVSQYMLRVKPKPPSPTNARRPFQPIESDDADSIPSQPRQQSTVTVDPFDEYQFLSASSILARYTAQQAANRLASGGQDGSMDLQHTRVSSDIANEESAVTPSKSTDTTTDLTEPVNAQPSTSSDIGRIVDMLV